MKMRGTMFGPTLKPVHGSYRYGCCCGVKEIKQRPHIPPPHDYVKDGDFEREAADTDWEHSTSGPNGELSCCIKSGAASP